MLLLKWQRPKQAAVQQVAKVDSPLKTSDRSPTTHQNNVHRPKTVLVVNLIKTNKINSRIRRYVICAHDSLLLTISSRVAALTFAICHLRQRALSRRLRLA